MAKPEIGMNSANSMNCDLEEEVVILSALKYDYIELRDWKLADYLNKHGLDELRRLLTERNVAPLAINTIEPITLGPGADRQRLTESADWRLRIAAEIRCPFVVAGPYGAGDELPAKVGRQQVVEGLKLVSDMAAEHGVSVAYEPLGSKTLPVHTVADTIEVLRQVDRPNVGWLFDVYHFHVADGSLKALAESPVDKLFLVHIDDVKDLPYEALAIPSSERVFPGDGASPLPQILRTLHQMGYGGPFSVELFNKEFLAWDPYEFAKTAKEKTEAMLDRYYR